MAAHRKEDDLENGTAGMSRMESLGSRNGYGTSLSKQVTIDAELFEKLYLQPKAPIAGDLRKRFANPTPIALLGFSVSLIPISVAFMGWRGAGGSAVATTTASIWFGGVLLLIAGFMEWVLGNFFPMVVFFGYGSHFLTLATTFIPYYNTLAPYNPDGTNMISAGFAASYAYYPLMLSVLSLAFLMGSLRTNLVFVIIFVLATIGFATAGAAFFYIAEGAAATANTMLVTTGACFFVAALLGWYLFFGAIIAIMELPIPDLPVFDLSTVIKARPRGVAPAQKPTKPKSDA